MEKKTGRYFPNRLKYFRLLFNLTQKEVAWILNVHPTKISKLERGLIRPDQDMLDALASLYQTTSHELYFDSFVTTRAWVVERKKLFWNMKNEKIKEETS